MKFFLRIPAWILSLIFLSITTLIALMLYAEIAYPYDQRPAFYRSINQTEPLLLLIPTGMLLLFAWFMAIIIQYCTDKTTAWLFIIPTTGSIALSGLLFVLMFFDFIWHPPGARAITNLLSDVINHFGVENTVAAALLIFLFTVLFAIFAAAKLTARHWRDWLWIVPAMLLFPIGVLFVQPRLRRLLDRKSVTETEDHFLDT